MELIYILKALWRKRLWVGLGVILATLAAVSTQYQIGPSSFPPKSKVVKVGAASTEILIDSPQSTLGNFGVDIVPLTARGGIFERFLATEDATSEIARESGIPEREIAVVGPKLSVDGVPDHQSAERAAKLGGPRKYLLEVQQGDELPVLTVFTQGPTKEGARRLANGAADALRTVVAELQESTGVRESRRLTIRQLGTARAGELVERPSKIMAFAAFIVVLGIFCLAILAWPSVRAAWREPEPHVPFDTVPTNGAATPAFHDVSHEVDEPERQPSWGAVPTNGGRKPVEAGDEHRAGDAERMLGL
jgi:hypothetical protein